ncbi:hypothetical protein [Blautia sp.]|uniref:hypothetical protein n=1 Tax=Blautia sp. TaxID=1955243 RepID=UPI002628BF34|nr:hypothetical protein [Blautia sp.]
MAELEELIYEVRQGFQIPPFFPDEGLMDYAKEGKARLSYLNPKADLKKDFTYRSLLKNYIYYAYHHKVHEWEENYKNLIVSWQLGSEV